MTDRLEAETGRFNLTGGDARMGARISAETWQFFAFVFAALTGLAFTLLDALPSGASPTLRVSLKVLVFGALGYVTLFNWPVKDFLIRCVLHSITVRPTR